MNGRDKIAKLGLAERLHAAKAKTNSVVDHLRYLIELHENNALVLYSPLLSSQIPTSHAANAFIVFQRGLHQIELVRLCALWDGIDPDKENIPTIIEIINRPDVLETLADETASHWKGRGIAKAQRRIEDQFGEQQAQMAREGLRKAIDDGCAIAGSTKLQTIMNLRNKHLAHSLSQTRREKEVGPISPMKYGDERAILEKTLPIVESLYCWVNGCSFSFNDSREIDRRNAKALWERCTFKIEY